ncbi:phage tail family protein [Saccharopolyspora sp. 6V]|uniref:phage tail family protein n=1 Tax=Saccharopolyspora sp. 6V TaxID=2877239 RepID=UPI001CD525AC|nr:phage tail family protein [Saccharopolyspora sp. 6V]MCA1191611.1 phage tail family protein [Saccharopolyspora sp. 6V]
MAIRGPRIHLDGISMGYRGQQELDEFGCEWIWTNLEGWWGTPGIRSETSDRPSGDGVFAGPAHRAGRVITLETVVTAPDEVQLAYARERYAGWCADLSTFYELRVDELTTPKTAAVRLDGEILPTPRTGYSDTISVQLLAPDARRYGAWSSASTGMATPGTGGIDSSAPGIDSSSPGIDAGTPGSTGIARALNPGTAPVSPLFTLTGPLTRPTVVHVETGSVLTYSGTLAANELLVINADVFPQRGYPGREVLLGGTARRRDLLARDGPWPEIPARGTAGFSLSAQGIDSRASLLVEWRPAYY